MELRHALRSLRRTPWYSLTVIGVIGLSMALATSVFAIVDGVLFKGLPYPNADELHFISGPSALSMQDLRAWTAATPDVPTAAYQDLFEVGVTADDPPSHLFGTRVGPGFLEVLGQRPILGGFQRDHFTYSSGRIPVLISYRLWRRHYSGRPTALGQPLDLIGAVDRSRRPLPGFEIVGVLPPNFVYPSVDGTPDLVLPLAPRPDQQAERNEGAMGMLARVPAGQSPEDVRSRLEIVAAAQGFGNVNSDIGNPKRSRLVGLTDIRTLMGFATGPAYRDAFAVAMVLVSLACVNIAALGLARGRQRRRELAVRIAIGASNWRIIRLGLIELAPLAALGTLAGLVVVPTMIGLVLSLMSPTASLMTTPDIDARVVAFAVLTTACLAIASVLMQGRLLRVGSVANLIRPGTGITSRRGYGPSVLLVVQVALAALLVVAGTLVVGSLWWAWQQTPGFDPGQGALVEISNGPGTLEQRQARLEQTIQRVRAIPGLQVGLITGEFLRRGRSVPPIVRPQGARPGREQWIGIGGGFFDVLGITPVMGRLPTDAELDTSARVAVLSERVARTFWPDANPIGQVLTQRSSNPATWTVIGVVRDARFGGIDTEPAGQIYWPIGTTATKLIARSTTSADATLQAMVREVRSVGAPVGVTRASTLEAALGEPMRERTFRAWLYGGFAAASLLIAGVGILGLVAMSTALRTKEVGIRCALGAGRADVVSMILREQSVPVVTGLVLGGVAAAWAVTYLKSSMYQFDVHDTRLWAVAILTILAASAIGTLIPAMRASRVNPVEALRAE